MDRTWSIWAQLAIVATSTLMARSLSTTIHCNASMSENVTCTAPYLASVVLHCPVDDRPVSSSWWFGRESVCGQPDCTIDRATFKTTGGYQCRGARARYYMQLNVHAPPALMKVSFCTTPLSTSCKSPAPLVSVRSQEMKAVVSYTGCGNFTVRWSKKSTANGVFMPFVCAPSHCVLDTSKPNQQSIAIQNEATNPFKVEDIGIYMANVSNEFGYNTTTTLLNISCDPRNAPLPPSQSNAITPITIKGGTTQNLSCTCEGEMDSSVSVTMCYQGQANTSDCGICPAYSSGPCIPIQSKPHWKINSVMTFPSGPCKPRRLVYATISGVQQNDSGAVRCYVSVAKYRTLYITYNVSVVYDLSSTPAMLPTPEAVYVHQSSLTTTISLAGSVSSIVVVLALIVAVSVAVCIAKGRDAGKNANVVLPITDLPLYNFGRGIATSSAPSSVDLSEDVRAREVDV